VPKVAKALAELSEPKDLHASFDKHLRELLGKVGEDVVVRYAVTLLDGADPSTYPAALRHLGGDQADLVLRKRRDSEFPTVWGARTLRYVWVPSYADEATRAVLQHLPDPRWRVSEMCVKVVRAHGLAEGADVVAALANHRLARMRVQAIRALGVIGRVEHLPVIHAALSDDEKDVRREAKKSLVLRAGKLGLAEDDVLAGRFPG
jgi:HEAT repeat protein